MTTSRSNSKATTLASVQALIAGTQKHFPKGNIAFGNATYTAATLCKLLQGLADAINALNAAQADAKDAKVQETTVAAQVLPVIRAYKRYLHATFTGSAPTLADFALTPPKARAPRTGKQLAATAAKAEATRQARGTVGSKKKLSIKGNVTGVSITPVTEPAAEPIAPAPAAPPAAASSSPTTK
jgi:hypothetical protein